MRLAAGLLLSICLLGFAVSPAAAFFNRDYEGCPSAPLAHIRVETQKQPLDVDLSRSTAQLQTLQVDSALIQDRAHARLGGLMAGELTLQSVINTNTLVDRRGQWGCLWLDEVIVEVTIIPKIYIARQYRPGSCEYAAVLEHELRHVQVEEAVVRRYSPIIRRHLQDTAARIGTVRVDAAHKMEAAQKRLNQTVQEALDTVAQRLFADRARMQQAVDTPAEYRRVAKQCSNW